MSSDLYEVIALAARYLFTLLGVLIVLRSFAWLLKDRAEKHRRLRRLPDAGRIGEFVVISGSRELPEGTVVPVSWEGVLGSVRSCDVCVPCSGVRKRHLAYSFQPGSGLLIHPLSGCEAAVNDTVLNCHSREDSSPMTNGSFLRAGSALLRLRLFSALDPSAGMGGPAPDMSAGGASAFTGPVPPVPPEGFSAFPPDGDPYPRFPAAVDFPPFLPADPSASSFMPPEPFSGSPADPPGSGRDAGPLPSPDTDSAAVDPVSVTPGPEPAAADPGSDPAAPDGSGAAVRSARRRRRSERWEADWSD